MPPLTPRPLPRLCAHIDRVSLAVARVARGMLLAVVAIGAFNAVARYLDRALGQYDVKLSSNAYLEFQWYLFGAIFMLASARALRRDAHVRVDVLYDRLPPRWRSRIDIAGHVLFLIPFCLFAAAISWKPVLDSWSRWEVSPDAGGLPRFPIKTVIPLGFTLLAMQGLSELVRRIAGLRLGSGNEELPSDPLGPSGHI